MSGQRRAGRRMLSAGSPTAAPAPAAPLEMWARESRAAEPFPTPPPGHSMGYGVVGVNGEFLGLIMCPRGTALS